MEQTPTTTMQQMLEMVERERQQRAIKRKAELEEKDKEIDALRTEATKIDLKIRRLTREKEQLQKSVGEEMEDAQWANDFCAW